MSASFATLGPPADQFVLGVDLDNTVADYSRGFWTWLNQRRGTPDAPFIPQDDYYSFARWGLTFDEFIALHAEAVADGLFRTLTPFPGAVQALNDLAAGGVRNRIVTARYIAPGQHQQVAADTSAWLDAPGANDAERAAVPYSDLVFTNAKHHVICDAWIDDSPSVIERLRECPWVDPDTVLCFDQPYNRHLDGPRVTSWAHALDVISQIRAAREAA